MNNTPKNEARRPLLAQITQNALLAMFLLAAGAFFVGILRTGVLYVGVYAVEPAPYFVGCIAVMIAAVALIVIIGRRWPTGAGSVTQN
jgi:hypothetical protein